MSAADSGARIRVLVADDHPVVRDGLRAYLAQHPGIEVVGEAGNGLELLEGCRRLAPDVVLLDHSMPGMKGIEAVSHLRFVAPRTRVVILTMLEDREVVREARRAGAHGFLVKDAAPAEVTRAILAVHAGEPFHTVGTSQELVDELGRELRALAPEPPTPLLSDREREVLALLASGLRSRDIAQRLRLGVRTVESHRLRIRRKLGLGSVAELTRYAIDQGLGPDSPAELRLRRNL